MHKLATLVSATIFAFTFSAGAAFACPSHAEGGDKDKKEQSQPKKVASATFKVEGITCEGCAGKIKASLGGKEGIVAVVVKVADKRIAVDFDAEKLTVQKIAEMITALGYKASPEA